ncbi:hypothetical protein [Nocardia wallacei]|uniref:hypothetical protein n=1 Tax=Nocardia wallacei TaxID=480035 RepID=UPI002454C5A2|nr:hypothetical protein [Nocardia wallacei]
MKPLRRPADPAKTAKNYLAAVLPGLVGAPVPTFGMVLPKTWTTASVPAVVVFDDGGPSTWPVSTRPTVRVTVWADGRDRARTIAGAALGVLLAHRIPGIAAITNPTGLLEAVDSNNGGITASFTVSATARTLAV